MGIVPILFDKSAFQGLSARELTWVHEYFLQNIPPILVKEIVADIKKEYKDAIPEEKVAQLARKFDGSGGPINIDYLRLLGGSLEGADVPMTGQIAADYMRVERMPEGGLMGHIGVSPVNQLILRLASKDVTEHDHEFARAWRESTANLSLSDLHAFVARHQIIFPSAETTSQLAASVNSVLDAPALQNIWLEWLLEAKPIARRRNLILLRWQDSARCLATFAPFAYHCLRTLLLLVVAHRSKLLPRWKSTDLIDIQYLYYLPFCYFFVSGDRVHKLLASLLLHKKQRFLSSDDFKTSIREVASYFEGIGPADKDAEMRALGGRLPLLANPLVAAWEEVIPRKRPGDAQP